MVALLVAIAGLCVAVVAFVRVVIYLRRVSEPASSRFVVITTKRGESYRGRARARLRSVVLLEAEALRERGEPLTISGRLEIRRSSIELIQRLPGRAQFAHRAEQNGHEPAVKPRAAGVARAVAPPTVGGRR